VQNVWTFIDTLPLAHFAAMLLVLLVVAVVLTAIEIRRGPAEPEWDLIRAGDGEIIGVVDMGRRREQKKTKGIDGETYRAPRI
jgi:hypothetical protein